MKYFILILIFLFSNLAFSSALVIKNDQTNKITLQSHLYFYGAARQDEVEKIAAKINKIWNREKLYILVKNKKYLLQVKVSAQAISEQRAVELSRGPQSTGINFIRLNEIPNTAVSTSFMVGHKNSGIWLLSQVLQNETTAAHEWGHSLGLDHPEDRIQNGIPRLMLTNYYYIERKYWVNPDAPDYCEENIEALGCEKAKLNLNARRLLQIDVDELQITQLQFDTNNLSSLGDHGFIFLFDEEGIPL